MSRAVIHDMMLTFPQKIGIALVVMTISGNTCVYGAAECNRNTFSKAPSPDYAWVAFQQEETCSDGAFVTTAMDVIGLVPRGDERKAEGSRDSLKTYDIFASEAHGAEYRPIIKWLSPQILQITVPNRSFIGLQKNTFNGIDIVVRFNPDDPEERRKLLESRGTK